MRNDMALSKEGVHPPKKNRIMIVEDHPVFRMGLRELIDQEDDLVVCGESDDAGKAFDEISRLNPDLVIVDISLKGRDGIELVQDVRKHYKDLPTLVLSMHDESRFAERSLLAGAKGYIMKRETSSSIVDAIRCVLGGKLYVSEKLKAELLDRFASGVLVHEKTPTSRLTDRELEVFQLLGHGLSTGEIAKKLSLSAKTIGTYRERIKEKLNLRHANELIWHAMLWVEKDRSGTVAEE
jgi:DNA-binding NarL/FixJ family response regulator